MVGLSATGEAAVLAPLTAIAYVSLHNADPGVTGANEITGGAYARQGTIAFANVGANPTVASNTAIVTFPQAVGNWGTVTHFGPGPIRRRRLWPIFSVQAHCRRRHRSTTAIRRAFSLAI